MGQQRVYQGCVQKSHLYRFRSRYLRARAGVVQPRKRSLGVAGVGAFTVDSSVDAEGSLGFGALASCLTSALIACLQQCRHTEPCTISFECLAFMAPVLCDFLELSYDEALARPAHNETLWRAGATATELRTKVATASATVELPYTHALKTD